MVRPFLAETISPETLVHGVPERLGALLKLTRPRQWIKNGLVFAALVFSGQLRNPAAFIPALLAFAGFCLAASAVYSLNDALDAKQDAVHPKKRFRPVAAGLITPGQAAAFALLLAVGALGVGFTVAPGLSFVLAGYLAINLLYSVALKHMVFLDIMSVAAGFVLRAVGGAVAVGVLPSMWFLVCVLLLSLFLAVVKRRQEAVTLQKAVSHRSVLADYPVGLLDQLIAILSGAVIVSYLLYAMDSARPVYLISTSPFVIYGIFRYLYLMHVRAEGGSPEETLLSDGPLLTTIALWAVACIAVVYLV